MIFLFYFAGLVATQSLSPSQLHKYETKLRKYQNLTNIDEVTFQEIWATGSQNIAVDETASSSTQSSRQQGLTMARYSMTSSIAGDQIPLRWDTREFNLGITYHNGIITITEPGYYKIIATCYCYDQHPKFCAFDTIVNGNKYLYTYSSWTVQGFMHGTIRLDVFDTVFFSKFQPPALRGGRYQNYFTIEKL